MKTIDFKSTYHGKHRFMKLSSRYHVLQSKYQDQSDEALMEMIQKEGDQMAITEIYQRYKKAVYNLLLRVVYSQQLAEELTAETFLTVFSKAEQYDPEKKFTTWLWTIARRKGIDQLRKKNEKLHDDWKTDEDSDHPIDFLAHDEATPEAALIEKSDQKLIADCFEKLSPEQREILSLRIFSEEAYAQIAQIVNKTEANIKTILFRAREAIKACVEGQQHE